MPTKTYPCECGNHSWFCVGKGYVGLVDVRDAPIVERYSWHSFLDNNVVYVQHRAYYTVNSEDISWNVKLHQKLLSAPKGWVPDHRNRNGLDNRSMNLRPSSNSQNIANSRPMKNAFGYRGVSIDRRCKSRPYYVHIQQKTLGFYANPEEAARAYDAAALAMWGEFATLNFPQAQAAE